ncbi:MAG: helix-turn-helix domain containing protein [Spirochaetales bacterium]|nr:helix-turn-helix domain containing protein [Spirochaetales bacterium]
MESSVSPKNRLSTSEKSNYVSQWKASGLSQKQFCRNMGISPTTFSGWIHQLSAIENRKEVHSIPFIKVESKTPSFLEHSITMEYHGARINLPQSLLPKVIKELSKVNG